MAASRSVLLKLNLIPDLGTVALLVTASGIAVAVGLFLAVRGAPLRFLFERPAWARVRTQLIHQTASAAIKAPARKFLASLS
jgi:hypothetical protein